MSPSTGLSARQIEFDAIQGEESRFSLTAPFSIHYDYLCTARLSSCFPLLLRLLLCPWSCLGGFIARMDPDGSNVELLAHNLRNSYENCVTSFGDIFASDNDGQPACRVFAVLEGGNYGFASAD